MLLPDQTYADYVTKAEPENPHANPEPEHTNLKSRISSNTSTTSYEETARFFDQIPDFVGVSLPALFYTAKLAHGTEEDSKDVATVSSKSITTHSRNGIRNHNSCHSEESANCDIMLRLCEDFICRHRMRADFFCQYHKAVSSTTPSSKQSKASPVEDPESTKLKSSKEPPTIFPNLIMFNTAVKRFTRLSAIYTLPIAKRKKKTTGYLTDASSSNEAVHLQQRLNSLSTELLVMRDRLHVEGQGHVQNRNNEPQHQHHTGVLGGNRENKGKNFNTTASSPNLNFGTALSTKALQQHVNGSGQHTLPKQSQNFGRTVAGFSNPSGAIIPARNTSIPHPLPHQLSDRTTQVHHHQQHQSNKNHTSCLGASDTVAQVSPTYIPNASSNTLPKRSSCSLTAQQMSANKHINPCQSVRTLPFGFAFPAGAGGGSSAKLQQSCREPKDMQDLIHMPGPLTEHAVMHTLQARFNEQRYFTNVGPILLSINPYLDVGNPLTLSSTRDIPLAAQLQKIVQEAVRQQSETGYPQAIILSGTSGAGKTANAMLMLRQLFAIAGGGPETDAFKHLAAAFTVLRSLGSAKTTTNSESSRIGQFIEVQVTDGALYRTKIHCYFLDQTRVIRPLPKEKNYHIFYQLLAGLNRDERLKLHLEGYSPNNLRYLRGDNSQNELEDAARFQAWKTCLGILGIPFLDVVRVLSAVLLLGNVQFIDTGIELLCQSKNYIMQLWFQY
ncbi:myosin-G heavy chain isoform X4 [Drosophila busckii]|uniref:myosin-G heavy chain isoform X4 n=1 Tax=Drosophila busckii TaxID=30019 RepID=UPI0014334034|nr:myosin-G heavy chain isoform X4 [Drosophila busckii]